MWLCRQGFCGAGKEKCDLSFDGVGIKLGHALYRAPSIMGLPPGLWGGRGSWDGTIFKNPRGINKLAWSEG